FRTLYRARQHQKGKRMTEQQFIEALRAQGIELTQHQISQFRTYFEMLVEWNEKINLTAVTGEEEVYLKHFYDSLTPLFKIDIKRDADICDVRSEEHTSELQSRFDLV